MRAIDQGAGSSSSRNQRRRQLLQKFLKLGRRSGLQRFQRRGSFLPAAYGKYGLVDAGGSFVHLLGVRLSRIEVTSVDNRIHLFVGQGVRLSGLSLRGRLSIGSLRGIALCLRKNRREKEKHQNCQMGCKVSNNLSKIHALLRAS